MGIPAPINNTPPAGDRANAVLLGQLAAAPAVSPLWMCYGPFNVVFGGVGGPNGPWSGTIALERSFDGGVTWYVCNVGGGGQQAIYTVPNQDISLTVTELELGVLYRLHSTVLTVGPVNYRFSTSGAGAFSLAVNPGVA